VAGRPPTVDLEYEKRLHRLLVELASQRLISSAHDTSDGGLAVALAECCLQEASFIGAQVKLQEDIRPDLLLFGEDQGRVIISLAPQKLQRVVELSKDKGVPCQVLGSVGGEDLTISWPTGRLSVPLKDLFEAWSAGLTRHIQG